MIAYIESTLAGVALYVGMGAVVIGLAALGWWWSDHH